MLDGVLPASSRKRSTALAGVVPLSAVKARAKCRGLMAARSARRSTVSGSATCARIQSSSATNRPVRPPDELSIGPPPGASSRSE